MVLVDTSVWIRYLYGVPPYRVDLAVMLNGERVVGHQFVYGELLIGDPGGGRTILTRYGEMTHAPAVPHVEVAEFVKRYHLSGRGLSWIDANLLASALVGHHQLWTADAALARVAQELGVAY